MQVGSYRLIEAEKLVGKSTERLEDLYRAESSHALRLAFLLTGSREAAEDITQEAFVKISPHLIALRDPDHARAYLLRTVTNLARTRGRRINREKRAHARVLSGRLPSSPDEPAAVSSMWARISKLPARQRAALFLRYYMDLSEAQAASALGCSVAALKSLVNRGLKALKEATDENQH